MAVRLERVRGWVSALGAVGAFANARAELEQRSAEHAMLRELALRVPVPQRNPAEAA